MTIRSPDARFHKSDELRSELLIVPIFWSDLDSSCAAAETVYIRSVISRLPCGRMHFRAVAQKHKAIRDKYRYMAVKLIDTKRFGDDRGWFSEVYVRERWERLGVGCQFVQDNESFSVNRGTIRGIHFQAPPHAQAKLVRCTRGRIIDYAVDLRSGSPTYGEYVQAELSRENGRQLYIPVGFGHAFITLEPECDVSYKVSDYYAPDCDGGVRWDCPRIGIDWPLDGAEPTLSAKDAVLPGLADFESPFAYDGRPLELISV